MTTTENVNAPYSGETTPPPSGPARDPEWDRWRRSAEPDPRRKSVPLACLLSLMPGLGQVYVGYYRIGFIHIAVVGLVMTTLVNEVSRSAEPLLTVFMMFFFLYNIVDAGRRAAVYNQALTGVEGTPPPQDLRLPAGGGTMIAGVGLIVLGAMLLAHNVLDISLEWVSEWWPVIPIGVGAYLVWLAYSERALSTSKKS